MCRGVSRRCGTNCVKYICEYKCEYRCEYMCEIFCWCEQYCTRGERAGYEMGTHDAIEDVIMCEKSVNAVAVLAKTHGFWCGVQ